MRTFKGRETAIEQELEIAEVPLSEGKRGELLGLGSELGLPRGIAGEEVLEDPAVGSERHLEQTGVVLREGSIERSATS